MKPNPEPPDGRYASHQEVRDAIEGLQKVDYAKLTMIARVFSRSRLRGSVVEPADLLHDAIVKTLDGQRRWNKDVSIIKHLDRVMESDSSHIAEKQTARKSVPIPIGDEDREAQIPPPHARLAATDDLDAVLEIFQDDKIALEILRLKGSDYSATEIQHQLGIGIAQYETATRRIRRRLAKYMSEGGY